MHPIFVHRSRLGLYLVAWMPVAALLAALLVLVGGSTWLQSVLLAAPLTLVYAFLCLAAWYPCRALPIDGEGGLFRVLGVHAATAVISASAWVGMAWVLARMLERQRRFEGLADQLADQVTVVFAIGFMAYWLSVAVHYLLLAFERSRSAERRALEAHLSAKDAELAMLRAQVDPHFLFNSLNSISSLTVSDPEAARAMCIELGGFLRSTLKRSAQQLVSLDEELASVRRFLAIEKLRFGDRLAVVEDIGRECGAHELPPMVLQPLVENALKHGISQLVEGGTLRLGVRCGERGLRITVSNPVDPDSPARRGDGVGLSNLRRRLDASYGGDAWLRVRRGADSFEVELEIPRSAAGNGQKGEAR